MGSSSLFWQISLLQPLTTQLVLSFLDALMFRRYRTIKVKMIKSKTSLQGLSLEARKNDTVTVFSFPIQR